MYNVLSIYIIVQEGDGINENLKFEARNAKQIINTE